MEDNEREALLSILKRDARYPIAAYEFVADGVQYTVHSRKRDDKKGIARHVTGQELLQGIMEYALIQYGFLAPDIFEYWNFRKGRDVGNTVYAMIGAQILSASPNDRIEDFDGVDDLVSALRDIAAKQKSQQ